MTYFPDLASCAYFGLADASKLKAVGWLDSAHAFPTGPVDADLVMRLVILAEDPWEPCRFMGYHACEFCTGGPELFGTIVAYGGRRLVVGARNLFIPGMGAVYVTPSLVLHYLLGHQYRPPTEFVEAVRSCPGMHTAEYLAAIRHNGPTWLDDDPALL